MRIYFTKLCLLFLILTSSSGLSHAATVEWTGAGGNASWQTAANWSGNVVPGLNDNVVVNVAGDVTISSGASVTILSLNCSNNLTIASGSFNLKKGASVLAGRLTMNSGTSLTLAGTNTVLTVSGASTNQFANLSISAGAVLTFSDIATATVGNNFTWQADGSGSRLAFPSLTNLVGNSQWFYLNATAGGRLELGLVQQIANGYIRAKADGSNSVVDFSSLRAYQPTIGSMSLQAFNKGAILVPLLVDGQYVSLDIRSGGSISTDQFTRLNEISLTGGATTFTGLTNVDFTSLSALGGAAVTIPNVTTAAVGNSSTWQADGSGSRLVLPNLTSLAGNSQWFYLSATAGGRLELGQVQQIANGYIRVKADGLNSVADLSSLHTYQPSTGSMTLQALNKGAILAPLLVGGEYVTLDIRSGGTISTDQFTRLNEISLTGGAITFSGLTNLDFTALSALGGAVVTIPNISTAAVGNNLTWQVDGSGSRLVLPNLTSLAGSSQWFYLSATAGGKLELGQVQQIANGYIRVKADGLNSVVDLSSLRVYQPSTGYLSCQAFNKGAILLPLLVDGEYVSLDIRSGGTISTDQFTRLNEINLTGGTTTFSGLTNVDFTSLSALGGAVVTIPNISTAAEGNNVTWQADGSGSRLVLPNLTNLVGNAQWFYLSATAGGRLELGQVQQIANGYIRVKADGLNSVVDLSSLRAYQPTTGNLSCQAFNKGAILLPLLVDGEYVSLDIRSGGTISTDQFTRLNEISLTGGAITFSGLTNLDFTALSALGGAVVTIPNISTAAVGNNLTWQADGFGSRLVFSNLTSLVGNAQWFYLSATTGGRLELGQVQQIANGYIKVKADGLNSVADLSSLRAYQPSTGYMTLQALNNGAILVPLLVDGGSVSLDLRSGGSINTDQFVRLNAVALVGMSVNFIGLTNLDFTGLDASGGAVLTVPNVETVAGGNNTTWQADGVGSRLVLPALTTITGNAQWFYVYATAGGRVELGHVSSVADGYIRFRSDGAGSLIDLSHLTGFAAFKGLGYLESLNNGAFQLTDQALLLENVSVSIKPPNPIVPSAIASAGTLTLYGQPWHSYWIEQRNVQVEGSPWTFFQRVPLTNSFSLVSSNPPPVAYRVSGFVTDLPILDIFKVAPDQFQLVLYGATNKNYQVEWKNNLSSNLVWQSGDFVSMTNSFRIFPPAPVLGNKFFRAKEQ